MASAGPGSSGDEVEVGAVGPTVAFKDTAEDRERAARKRKRKQKGKAKATSGGFQSMGLSFPVLKGVLHKGYKVPTPIQRKCIPLIMDGRDVVAMARTGSGKTAAFLVPLLEKLHTHCAKVGMRALIMSPTRELAIQTYRFAKELGKHTDLRISMVLGGDSLNGQFEDLHANPDVVIATPGRFLHVVVTMELPLTSIEYVVFDEADRLFEMGFQTQLEEILIRLPADRQACLFSATLPKLLIDFARLGLQHPTLVRLDVDTKLSEKLETQYFFVSRDDKLGTALHLLQNVIPAGKQTVLFAATKHHVEYLRAVFLAAGIDCTYCYGDLDQAARKINVAKFRAQKAMLLLVTDVAARGIDIPLLDYVINFDFPAKPKLFVHRVGRVARAGRPGTAFSLVSRDELGYMLDLHVFLGRGLKVAADDLDDGVLGGVPQAILDTEREAVTALHSRQSELNDLLRVSANAYKLHDRSRAPCSQQSTTRAKALVGDGLPIHPFLHQGLEKKEIDREALVHAISSYRPRQTVFEAINPSTAAKDMMKSKRGTHSRVIRRNTETVQRTRQQAKKREKRKASQLEASTMEDYQGVFEDTIIPRRSRDAEAASGGAAAAVQVKAEGDTVYIPYRASDSATEKGLAIRESFEQSAAALQVAVIGDDTTSMQQSRKKVQWDRKRKRYVNMNGNLKKRVKTENGTWIDATYKSDRYDDWVKKNNARPLRVGDEEAAGRQVRKPMFGKHGRRWHTQNHQEDKQKARRGGELRSKDNILKDRRKKEWETARLKSKAQRKARSGQGKKKR